MTSRRVIKAFKNSEIPLILPFAAHGSSKKITLCKYFDPETGLTITSRFLPDAASPFGEGNLERIEESSIEIDKSVDLSDLKKVGHCDECDTIHTTLPELASALDGEELNCIVCGSEMVLSSDDEDEEKDSDDEDEEDDSESDSDDEDEDEDEEDDSDSEDDDEEDDSDSDDEDKEKDSDDDDSEDEDEEDDSESDDEDDSENKNEDESDDEDKEEKIEAVEAASLDVERIYDLSANLGKTIRSSANLDLVLSSSDPDTYYVMAEYAPVALISKARASEQVANFFGNKEKILSSLKTAIQANGFNTEVAKDFGIVKMHLEIPYNNVVKQKISRKRKELSDFYEQKSKSYSETFRQSIMIAALGIAKGLYSDNGVKAEMEETLSRFGVRNPEKVVATLMTNCSEKIIASWFEKADEIIQKPIEARNEAAIMVESASFNFVPSDNEDNDAITERLDNSRVISFDPIKKDGPDSSDIKMAVASLGRRK
jgi:segregation and condensation protein B